MGLQGSKMPFQSHSGENQEANRPRDIDISVWIQRDRYGNLVRITHYCLRENPQKETAQK